MNCLPFLGHEKWDFSIYIDLRDKHSIEARWLAFGFSRAALDISFESESASI